jgi:polyisoprenoid-binding protein YceI
MSRLVPSPGVLLVTASPLSPTTAPAADRSLWTIDPAHTLVEFSVRHMMISTVKGRFVGVQGTIVDVAGEPSLSSVEVTIDPATITTADDKRDAHLRSADFFDVETYPMITFKSTSISGSRDAFTVTGDLTIRDRTQPVTLEASYNGEATSPYGHQIASFTASTRLSRKDWGLNWNVALEAGGVMVSDQFKVELEIQAIKQS